MFFRIRHTTSFDYDGPVYQSHNEVRVRPRDSATQRCVQFELQIEPHPSTIEYADYYGNTVHAFAIYPPHNSLSVTATSIVEQMPEVPAAMQRVTIEEFLMRDAIRSQAEYDFLNASRHVPFSPAMKKFFWLSRPDPAEDVTAYATRINESIRQQFEYEPGRTRVHSTADEILTVGGGVCQDFAHLAIGVLRLAGIPARYCRVISRRRPTLASKRSARRPATPGSRRNCRDSAGRGSIRPTDAAPTIAISASPMAAIIPTCRHCAASIAACRKNKS
ncbi:MAG: transglutaminase N-terminal domain-containing protein [Candidatus Binatus sp.]|uniref:transglutaminase family protein n=1 Tax=Candidatus Binatus sp. TaxID=2811406 RepID=UPI00271EA19C|nr:transglutaminase N-terminal domain-containing protein [Candidatus Binatus sp.]MDO8433871.1 transglutaminase N-terminal domain-containing protein [Candidatus Binatus sp.]